MFFPFLNDRELTKLRKSFCFLWLGLLDSLVEIYLSFIKSRGGYSKVEQHFAAVLLCASFLFVCLVFIYVFIYFK